MKIRSGFVSNSSSSSFLIYGVYLDTNEELKSKFEDKGLFTSSGADGCSLYAGRSWDSIKDDETGAQFKARVKAEIEACLGEVANCSTHEDSWYDG